MNRESTDITRIFVLGRHRSGTTWVTNILASHPHVFVPTHPAHKGQHESAFFSGLLRYCRWGKTLQDRLALKAIFERSDYYHLLHESGIRSVDISNLTPAEYFAQLMDNATAIRGKSTWAEKTPAHTLHLSYLIKNYPEAKFVAVRRHHLRVIESNVYKLYGAPNLAAWIHAAFMTVVYEKMLDFHETKIHFISYEDLLNDYDQEVRRLMNHVGLDYAELQSEFLADSSFGSSRPEIPVATLFLIKVLRLCMNLVPPLVYVELVNSYISHKQSWLPAWFFKVFGGTAIAIPERNT